MYVHTCMYHHRLLLVAKDRRNCWSSRYWNRCSVKDFHRYRFCRFHCGRQIASMSSFQGARTANECDRGQLTLPKLATLPCDPENPQYARSFDARGLQLLESPSRHEMKRFFDQYGYVIVSNLYSSEECSASRDAMWQVVESTNPGMSRDDPQTWSKLKAKGRYGLSLRQPSFHPTLVNNRQVCLQHRNTHLKSK